jgi:hypothetical protein
VARNQDALRNASSETHLAGAMALLAGSKSEPAPLPWSGAVEWYTPAAYVEAARQVMGGIDLDPASNDLAQEMVRASTYHTAETDGLAQEWTGRVWLNPPYAAGEIDRFVSKLVAEHTAGNVTEAVLLVHSRTDTAWFHEAAEHRRSNSFHARQSALPEARRLGRRAAHRLGFPLLRQRPGQVRRGLRQNRADALQPRQRRACSADWLRDGGMTLLKAGSHEPCRPPDVRGSFSGRYRCRPRQCPTSLASEILARTHSC